MAMSPPDLTEPPDLWTGALTGHQRMWYRRLTEVPRRLYSLTWSPISSSDADEMDPQEEIRRDRHEVQQLEAANAYSSQAVDSDRHCVAIDLDVPAVLVPSATPGHSHLIIDVDLDWQSYKELLETLASAGVIEDGYAQASIRRRASFLRLPWYPKGTS